MTAAGVQRNCRVFKYLPRKIVSVNAIKQCVSEFPDALSCENGTGVQTTKTVSLSVLLYDIN